MKATFTIFLTLIYAIASAGVSVKVHYCGKHISSVTFYSVAQAKCCCKPVSKKAACCTDKEIKVSLKEVQKVSPVVAFTPLQLQDFVAEAFHVSNFELVCTPEYFAPRANEPPGRQATALFLTNCCFRI